MAVIRFLIQSTVTSVPHASAEDIDFAAALIVAQYVCIAVLALVLSADGQTLALGCWDGFAKLLHVGRALRT